MRNLIFLAAAWAAVEQSEFLETHLQDECLSYVVRWGTEQRITVPWKRKVWVAPLLYSQTLLGRSAPQEPSLGAAWLDWASRVEITGVLGSNRIRAWNRWLCWYSDPADSLFETAWAIREGYYVIEVPGEGIIVRTPGGRTRTICLDQCDCLEGLAGKDCLHKRLARFYLSQRNFYRSYQNACSIELARTAQIC